jgi:HtrA serine peptidase 2
MSKLKALRSFPRFACALSPTASAGRVFLPGHLPYRASQNEGTRSRSDASQYSSRPPSNSSFWSSLALVGVGVSVGVALYGRSGNKHSFLPSPTAYCLDSESRRGFNFIAEAVEKAAPSVVYIETDRKVETFIGTAIAKSSGSGFVVEGGKYVLTNAHVVSRTASVSIKLSNGQTVNGEVTDTDEVADLALIKMDLPIGTTVPPLNFSDVQDIRPGEWVVAMGSPLSLTNTITCGIVSCLHRPGKELGLHDSNMEYVQTDAAITVGNSGGPLVNLDGEVVGVNTMTAAPGISFAIPSAVTQKFVRSANKKSTGGVGRVYTVGISMLTLSPQMMPTIQYYMSIPKEATGGVLLARVWPNSPAHQAGLKKGDVIVRINGREIKSSKAMYNEVQKGKKMSIEFYRKQQYMTCTVVPELMN